MARSISAWRIRPKVAITSPAVIKSGMLRGSSLSMRNSVCAGVSCGFTSSVASSAAADGGA